jgi:hypothetical protein
MFAPSARLSARKGKIKNPDVRSGFYIAKSIYDVKPINQLLCYQIKFIELNRQIGY